MPPEFAHFPVSEVRKVFEANGIFSVEDFSDGQTIWSTQKKDAFTDAPITIASEYKPGRYDIWTVRNVVAHLGKQDSSREIEDYLFGKMLKDAIEYED